MRLHAPHAPHGSAVVLPASLERCRCFSEVEVGRSRRRRGDRTYASPPPSDRCCGADDGRRDRLPARVRDAAASGAGGHPHRDTPQGRLPRARDAAGTRTRRESLRIDRGLARDEAAPPAEAPRETPPVASAAPSRSPAPVAEAKKPEVPPARPAATAAAEEAARAKALLEAKAEPKTPVAKEAPATPAAREGGRFVVQAGAFADAAAAREMRAKLEKLGLKSYTQVVETSSGNRTRVRAGPYASREEAEKALAKAKAAGVGAVVLTL
ncbi:hypothetical protein FSC37_12995 [Piscinibacter aquaticus]|uniref:SPOR domain-containing protein n=1 Tax=Piscinibacter aquaticus TaxID=392597 RepID=A0A5C6U107_9BURK|nr:hypothetical protein FSC37_12995 [Piscinibacter aquaticus]